MTDTDTSHDRTGPTIIDIREQDTPDSTDDDTPWTLIAFAALGGLFAGAALMALLTSQVPPLPLEVIA